MKKIKGMVDISAKSVSKRTARAGGVICPGKELVKIIKGKKAPKGDVLATAKVAAVMAVKNTPAAIPLCHPIPIEAVDVDFKLDEKKGAVRVTVTVTSRSKTGLEMEALSGVSAACLTIYDMLKYKGRDMVISDIKLLEKSGGKSGHYVRGAQALPQSRS